MATAPQRLGYTWNDADICGLAGVSCGQDRTNTPDWDPIAQIPEQIAIDRCIHQTGSCTITGRNSAERTTVERIC